MKNTLKNFLFQALDDCYKENRLDSGSVPDDILIEIPGNPDHGDFATNLAMTLAKAEKKKPRRIAEALVAALGSRDDLFDKIEIAGPGFINFHLTSRTWYQVLDDIYAQSESYGRNHIGRGRKIQVEFVSANPTGPLHIGHGRGAATGDALARLLAACGYEVQREYYINDAGNQMATLGRSIYLRCLELEGKTVDFPQDCYQGEYIRDLAREALAVKGPAFFTDNEEEALRYCSGFGGARILKGIEDDLKKFGVCFDRWYSEKTLYDRDEVRKGIEYFQATGLAYEKEGAVWFRSTDFGDDKDRVLLRGNGATTYFASDIAYHKEKFERGFDTVIDIWGADHHGYIPRMKAAVAALGRDREDLQIILVQLVNLLRGGNPVAMSTRAGEFVTLDEVVQEVGRDACRYVFLTRHSDSKLDFDLDLAKQQNADNPVYYVQYAHARICSVNRKAREEGLADPAPAEVDTSALTLAEELGLTKLLSHYPEMVEGAGRSFEPHRITIYLQDLAARFHAYYNRHRIIIDDRKVSLARLYLINRIRTVISNALMLLGVSAPEKM
jgi:arginyl-tRNA synthetase